MKGLDERPRALAPDERARVAAKIDSAVGEEEWVAAWNQAVDLGADRARFESIAVGALEDRADGDAEKMFGMLREKWGPLSAAARGRVDALVAAAREDGDWGRMAKIQILTADDPPKYAAAWAVYEETPPSEAQDVLDLIVEARGEGEKQD